MAERAVSTVVGYAIMLVVVGILASGIVLGATSYIETERADVTRTELTVVGNQLAADITAADTLAGTLSSTGASTVRSDLADVVAGSTYRIRITDGDASGESSITLESNGATVAVTITVLTDHDLATGRFNGGPLRIRATADDLEVSDG